MDHVKIDILEFIDKFRTKFGEYRKNKEESVRELFTDGFCYYFAKILQEAFPGGELCIPWPIGHFIYHYKGKYYDIEGEYCLNFHDCECAIPFEIQYFINQDYFEYVKLDFMHVLNYDYEETGLTLSFKYVMLYGDDYSTHNINLDKTEAHIMTYLIYNLKTCGMNDNSLNEWFKAVQYHYIFIDDMNRFKELVNFAKIITENKIKF